MPPSHASFPTYEDPSALSPPSPPYTPSCISDPNDRRDAVPEHAPLSPSNDTPRRRISAMTSASATTTVSAISSFPSEPPFHHDTDDDDDAAAALSLYTPMRDRPQFRDPSSVRALQMASPQPFERCPPPPPPPPPRSAKRHATPRSSNSSSNSNSSNSSSSTRSGSELRSGSSRRGSARSRPRHARAASRREGEDGGGKTHPLVLLHATLLPVACAWSAASMAAVLPPWVLENYRLLEEKTGGTVLRRGVLVPHPRDEYELLEEKLLESLELRTPRILKCGHFHGSEESGGDGFHGRIGGSGADVDVDGDDGAPASVFGDGDASACGDCHRPIKYPGTGVGSGKRLWDVKVYAANGLMRSGAWAAAWSEMERVDVEISPWVPEDARRELDRIKEEEEEEAELRMLEVQQVEEEERKRAEDALAGRKMRLEDVAAARGGVASFATRPEETVGYMLDVAKVPDPALGNGASREPPHPPSDRRIGEIPLGTLLRNYLYILANDRRNIAIALLGVIVISLCATSSPSSVSPTGPTAPRLPPTSVSTVNATVARVMPISAVTPSSSASAAAMTALSAQGAAGVQSEEEAVEASPPGSPEGAASQVAAVEVLSYLDDGGSHLDFIEAT